MNYRMISRILGYVLLITAALMILPLIAGLAFRESVLNFVITILLTAGLGGALAAVKPEKQDLFARDGFALVGLSWIIVSALGALPFVISGDIPDYIDAFFETVSGFTTTGATILTEVESMSRGCMFWRLFTHWIGGMGMLVFIMAILPMSGEHSMHILRAEVPGPSVGKLVPRAKKTALILYLIYGGFTVLETILLLCGGMSFYEALLHAFATAGTGGFSTRNASIGGFDSLYVEIVIAVFMYIYAINFNLYYFILIKKGSLALKSEELHVFLCIVLAAIAVFTFNTADLYGGPLHALRYSFFNVATLISTAGFGTADFTAWPAISQSVVVVLMFIGGCGGSTGGGLKLSRVMLICKSAFADFRQMIFPRSVSVVRMEGKRVDSGTVKAACSYFLLYMLLLFITTFIISFDGYDMTTNFTAAVSCLSNVGPGLGLIGPNGNFSIFSGFTKVIMAFAMLAGRLEIYPILVFLLPRRQFRIQV